MSNSKTTPKTGYSSEFAQLTHPEKVLYPNENPNQGITKKHLFEYLHSVQDWILPFVKNRLLTLVRCPNGFKQKCFFQKHSSEKDEKYLCQLDVKDSHGIQNYFYIKNHSGLLHLAQMDVLEIHPWGSHIRTLEKPDVIIFDLDPSSQMEWKHVVELAHFMRSELEKLNLVSFVKTTGGKGLHIVVPIKPRHSWDEVKLFSKNFASSIALLRPNICTARMSPAHRKGKIFIDYMRNARGSTAVAPYSPRARDGAPIATPLHWKELTSKIYANAYTIENFAQRARKIKHDPWEDFYKIKQSISISNFF